MTSTDYIVHDDGRALDFIGLCRLAWTYRVAIILVSALGGVIAAVYAYTATPVYRADVTVTEVRDQGTIGGAAGLMSQLGGLASLAGVNIGGADGAARESQAILQSRQLAEAFIKRHKLQAQIMPDAEKPPTLWQTVRRFRSGMLYIREDTRKGVTTIGIESNNPQTSAKWANDYVALANEIIAHSGKSTTADGDSAPHSGTRGV